MKKLPLFLLFLLFFLIQTLFLSAEGAAQPCDPWSAKAVSIQGTVEIRRVGENVWQPVGLDDAFCPGDVIRVGERSRAAILLFNDTVLRIDQYTSMCFQGPAPTQRSWVELIKGAAHFFSHFPKSLQVATPFVNGNVEGTEFYVRVDADRTYFTVFEGRVLAENASGRLVLTDGQSAIATAERPPELQTVVHPRDAVQWALYYPPVVDYRPENFAGNSKSDMAMRKSLEFYRQGDITRAFAALEALPDVLPDPRVLTYQAALLLSVGRVIEAASKIESALTVHSENSQAVALKAIIAIARNDLEKAQNLSESAVRQDPNSSAARVSLSYVRQAQFNMEAAQSEVQKAVEIDSENALAWARLAELKLSRGYLDEAAADARRAVDLNPALARTHTVLGFAHLTRMKIEAAKSFFEKAVSLDQAAPLPRLGLGLARIRKGDLAEGRREIEIAAALDPNRSLIRSYLGKVYYEEKKEKLAQRQLEVAKQLDPKDPTPYFYSAILKQTQNRPVESLEDYQRSVALNNNRAVYRSKLMLDQDLAVRSTGLARIYTDLGFQKRALAEGWKALVLSPGNFSAHRFLADSYANLPRHDIARVSELLQSQLRQPSNINPVQPQLAETQRFIPPDAAPGNASFNEYAPLFYRNRMSLLVSGLIGGK